MHIGELFETRVKEKIEPVIKVGETADAGKLAREISSYVVTPMIEGYLLDREELVMVFVLVDGEIGPTKLDLQMLEWLRHHEVDHCVVATKADRVKATKRADRQAEVSTACMLEPADVLWVSATKGTGIETLRSRVTDLLTVH